MSEFGTLNLEDIQMEDSRLNTEKQENFLDQFIQIPDPKPGQTLTFPMRLLPPRKGGKLFQYARLHLINDRKYQCPRPLVNGKWDYKTPCPICEYYNSLYRTKDKLEKQGKKAEAEKLEDEARSIKPIERYYYNAIARKVVTEKGEELNAGPKIFSCGKVLHKIICSRIMGSAEEPGLGDVTDVKSGYDFLVKKEMRGTGRDAYPNYDRSDFARENSAAGTPEEIQKWVQNLHDLTLNRKPTEVEVLEKQLAIHRGLIPDDAEGFDVSRFDEKWKGQQPTQKSPMETGVKNSVVNEAASGADSSGEDINIEDKEFLDRLAQMDESV